MEPALPAGSQGRRFPSRSRGSQVREPRGVRTGPQASEKPVDRARWTEKRERKRLGYGSSRASALASGETSAPGAGATPSPGGAPGTQFASSWFRLNAPTVSKRRPNSSPQTVPRARGARGPRSVMGSPGESVSFHSARRPLFIKQHLFFFNLSLKGLLCSGLIHGINRVFKMPALLAGSVSVNKPFVPCPLLAQDCRKLSQNSEQQEVTGTLVPSGGTTLHQYFMASKWADKKFTRTRREPCGLI